ncbi:MAG: GNAT family N-acetyltransferase [Thermodesulfobacteriota bacterium]
MGDPWQGQGIGAELMTCLIGLAKRRGHKKLWGLVLIENQAMIELARKLGGEEIYSEDASQVEVRLDL